MLGFIKPITLLLNNKTHEIGVKWLSIGTCNMQSEPLFKYYNISFCSSSIKVHMCELRTNKVVGLITWWFQKFLGLP